ncbi:hypothetical protein BC831DRAFT_448174 [Entophlyctis helioformis]|nr:hypothetical protein BC831DRAFT_448174 [Entophlyctis helioformis]
MLDERGDCDIVSARDDAMLASVTMGCSCDLNDSMVVERRRGDGRAGVAGKSWRCEPAFMGPGAVGADDEKWLKASKSAPSEPTYICCCCCCCCWLLLLLWNWNCCWSKTLSECDRGKAASCRGRWAAWAEKAACWRAFCRIIITSIELAGAGAGAAAAGDEDTGEEEEAVGGRGRGRRRAPCTDGGMGMPGAPGAGAKPLMPLTGEGAGEAGASEAPPAEAPSPAAKPETGGGACDDRAANGRLWLWWWWFK